MPNRRTNAIVVCSMGAFALAGVTCVGLGIYASWRTVTFRLYAQPIKATVLGKSWGTERIRSMSLSRMRYTVDYQFQAPGGDLVKNSAYFSSSTWDQIKEGSPLRVYYRPPKSAFERFRPALDQLGRHYLLRDWLHIQWRRKHRRLRRAPGHGSSAEVGIRETAIAATRWETREAAAG